jgi:hypothetical protein
LPSLVSQPPEGGLTPPPPPANRGGPPGLRQAEAEAPPHLMCPRPEPVHADRNRDGAQEEEAEGEDGKRVWLVATTRDPIQVDSKQPDNDRQEEATSSNNR